jgi:hypothetical protein
MVCSIESDEISGVDDVDEGLRENAGSVESSLDETPTGSFWRREGCMSVLA